MSYIPKREFLVYVNKIRIIRRYKQMGWNKLAGEEMESLNDKLGEYGYYLDLYLNIKPKNVS